jgi:type II secretory pathway component PulM
MMAAAFRVPRPLAGWLATKSRAERRIVTGVLILATVAVLWAAVWQPLIRDTAALRVAHATNAAALVEARRMAAEIGGLARPPVAEAPSDVRADLERILVQHSLRSMVTQLEWRDGRAHVVLAAVGYDALIGALEAMQRDARLRAVAATLTSRIEPGIVRAELTLAR